MQKRAKRKCNQEMLEINRSLIALATLGGYLRLIVARC